MPPLEDKRLLRGPERELVWEKPELHHFRRLRKMLYREVGKEGVLSSREVVSGSGHESDDLLSGDDLLDGG